MEFDDDVRAAVIKSLEKRWAAADQEVFIVAAFLNPYIRRRCFSRAVLTDGELYNMVARVFERLFGRRPDLDLFKAFMDYTKGQGEFSDDRMSLEMMAKLFAIEVSAQAHYSKFISWN